MSVIQSKDYGVAELHDLVEQIEMSSDSSRTPSIESPKAELSV